MNRFEKALAIVLAAAAMGVIGYQQFALGRLEQVVANLAAQPHPTANMGAQQTSDARPRWPALADRNNGAEPSPAQEGARDSDPDDAVDTPASAPSPEPNAEKPAVEKTQSVTQRLSTREGRVQWLGELAEAADLTPKQTGALETILNDEFNRRSRALERKQYGASKEDVRSELKQITKESMQQVRLLLDKDQFSAYLRRRIAPVTSQEL